MQQSLHTFFSLVGEMAPYLLLGFLVAGILHAFVPRRLYTRYLAGNDMRSVTAAALIGIPLPLCSCGVIPTAMSMHREGASRGATVSFLIATPQTGVDSIAATAALLGLPFALLRPVAALVTALGGGALVNLFAAKTPGDRGESRPARPEEAPHGFRARLLAALRYGFVDMIRDIGRWLIVGLLIAGTMLTRHSHDEKHTTMEQTYRIRGMMCNHCKANVERGLAALEGVTAVHVDLDEGTARVEGTAPRERVIREIERLGYRCEE